MNMKIGQAIRYETDRSIGYGVIIRVFENSIEFVDVNYIGRYTKCYDDVGAVYPDDKDNVRLKHCPPPFSKLSRGQ